MATIHFLSNYAGNYARYQSLILKYTGICLLTLTAGSVFSWNYVVRCVRCVQAIRSFHSEDIALSEEITRTRDELRRFKDNFYLENIARRELGLARQNETEYRFKESSVTSKQ